MRPIYCVVVQMSDFFFFLEMNEQALISLHQHKIDRKYAKIFRSLLAPAMDVTALQELDSPAVFKLEGIKKHAHLATKN